MGAGRGVTRSEFNPAPDMPTHFSRLGFRRTPWRRFSSIRNKHTGALATLRILPPTRRFPTQKP